MKQCVCVHKHCTLHCNELNFISPHRREKVCVRESVCLCVYVCVREGERERKRERESVYVCVCAFVCVWERAFEYRFLPIKVL